MRPRDRGSVTAEMAVCLPVLVLLLAVAVSAVTVAGARVRAQDAAREAARALARGDTAAARRLVADAAPGARLSVARAGDNVTATVRVHESLLADWLPSVIVTGRATAAMEPGQR